ncbi:MAG: GNAT family N-acetyltransferase [Eubacteriales bacterium]|nr:GNAT family N-acetyltransferase [Eubacteriales bacterium]
MENNQREKEIDIFFKLEYGKLYESIEKGTTEIFEFEKDGFVAQNLYIKRPVPYLIQNKQYFDTITPYGYGGPVLIKGNPNLSFINQFYNAWSDYCNNNSIVSEFVRYHLFDNPEFREVFPGEVLQISDNVVRQLNPDMEKIWMDFAYKVRKNVNKARNCGLTVTTDATGEHLEAFIEIYNKTMERNDARSFYYFKKEYFDQIIGTMQGSFMFFHVWKDSIIVSSELVLYSNKYVYSFLGGTLEDFYPLRPNELLKYEIINWSKESGHEVFVLGGGYGGNDGIYRYKKSFTSGEDIPFYVGRMVHNRKIYNELVEIRRTKDGVDENFFPLYRA